MTLFGLIFKLLMDIKYIFHYSTMFCRTLFSWFKFSNAKPVLLCIFLLYNFHILNCSIMLPKRNQSSILLLLCAPYSMAYKSSWYYVQSERCDGYMAWSYLRGCRFMYYLNYLRLNMYQTIYRITTSFLRLLGKILHTPQHHQNHPDYFIWDE